MAKRDLAQAFAIEVKSMRTSLGVSQEQLAEKAGLHRNYVGMIERERQVPTLRALEGLAEALKVRPSELIARAERRRG